jgi:hypothetical protein
MTVLFPKSLQHPKTENRKQKTENRKQKTENRKQKTEKPKGPVPFGFTDRLTDMTSPPQKPPIKINQPLTKN